MPPPGQRRPRDATAPEAGFSREEILESFERPVQLPAQQRPAQDRPPTFRQGNTILSLDEQGNVIGQTQLGPADPRFSAFATLFGPEEEETPGLLGQVPEAFKEFGGTLLRGLKAPFGEVEPPPVRPGILPMVGRIAGSIPTFGASEGAVTPEEARDPFFTAAAAFPAFGGVVAPTLRAGSTLARGATATERAAAGRLPEQMGRLPEQIRRILGRGEQGITGFPRATPEILRTPHTPQISRTPLAGEIGFREAVGGRLPAALERPPAVAPVAEAAAAEGGFRPPIREVQKDLFRRTGGPSPEIVTRAPVRRGEAIPLGGGRDFPFIVDDILELPRNQASMDFIAKNAGRINIVGENPVTNSLRVRLGGQAALPPGRGGPLARLGDVAAPTTGAPARAETAAFTRELNSIVSGSVDSLASPVSQGNKFVAALRPFNEVISEVVTTDNATLQGSLRGPVSLINPSVLKNTEVGRAITAFERQRVATGELVETTLGAALDSHARSFSGRLPVAIDNDGFVKGTGKLWQDVFSKRGTGLGQRERAYIDDFLSVVDEVEKLRIDAGLKPRPKLAGGALYVPRQVEGIRGIELVRPSNPNLQRVYEEATVGRFVGGINYKTSPRDTLDIHLRAAYREIAEKQLADALEPISVTARDLVSEGLRNQMSAAVRRRLVAEREVRRLRVPRANKTGPSTAAEKTLRKELADQRQAANAEFKAARADYAFTKGKYVKAMEAARKAEIAPGTLFGLTDDAIPIASWRNRFFPREQAEQLTEALGAFGRTKATANFAARGVGTLVNQIRFLSAVGDFAEPFIQGLPVLAENPVAWARATTLHYRAFFDPTVQAKFIRDHLSTFQEMARHGVAIGDPEFFAALQRGQGIPAGALLELLPKGQEARRFARQAGRQTFGRFQASYNVGLGSARALVWEGLEDAWTGSKAELASYINNLSGGLNSRALGVSPSVREVEGIWLAFSPRLLRSTVALVNDAVQGSISLARPGVEITAKQQRSMQSLGKLAAGATAMYTLSGAALGKDWEQISEGLNPLNGKRFLSHEINGDWIGVGGQVRAIAQFAAHLGSTLAPGGESLGNIVSANQFDNPLIGLYMSRGAVGVSLVGTGVEAATGGEVDVLPFDNIDSVPSAFRHIGERSLPFAVQGILDGEQATTVALALAGARTSPQTTTELIKELRREEMEKRGIPESRREDADLVASVDESSSEIQIAKERRREERRAAGNEVQEFLDGLDEVNRDIDGRIAEIAKAGPSEDFRFDLSELQTERGTRKNERRLADPESVQILDELEPGDSEFNKALDDYFVATGDPTLVDRNTGDFDFKQRDANIEALEFTPEMIARIEEFLQKNDHPLVAELRRVRDFLEPYFETAERIMRQEGFAGTYEIYRKMTDKDQAVFRERLGNERFAETLNDIVDAKALIRERNPVVNQQLIRWGYKTPNKVEVRALLEAAGAR